MKHIFLIGLFLVSSVAAANDGRYALAIGDQDKERLLILNEVHNPITTDFLDLCEIHEGQSVLEIGCGIGLVSQVLADRVGADGFVLATDINKAQLEIARSLLPEEKFKHLAFQRCSALELNQLSQTFDVVYVRFLLCHLPDPQAVVRQVRDVLKPGGLFIIEDLVGNDTAYTSPNTKAMDIVRRFDCLQFEVQQSDDQYFAQLPALLKAEGFDIIATERRHPALDTPRKRKLFTYGLLSMQELLLHHQKITEKEFSAAYPIVEQLETAFGVEAYHYAFGQICARKTK